MPDRGTVRTASRLVRGARTSDELTVTVTVRGAPAVFPALTIEGARYEPAVTDDVETIPLSDGSRLILGPTS